jgi:hypothetical protein
MSRFLRALFATHPAAGDQAKHGSFWAPGQELDLPFPVGGDEARANGAARARRQQCTLLEDGESLADRAPELVGR